MIGVFGCDPGGNTGLAWAVLDPGIGDVAEALRLRKRAGSTTVEGDDLTQIREITEMWKQFYINCRGTGLVTKQIWFVCEDFVLRPGETAGGRDSTIPLAIMMGIRGYLMAQEDARRGVRSHTTPFITQMAGQAATFANRDRLKEWGLWVVGREHERSAWCHVALFLQRYIQQHG